MKPRITTIAIGVDDLEKSLHFYRDGLGLATEGIIGKEFLGHAGLHPYGSHPKGLLIYDEQGNVAVQLLRAERQRFSTEDKSQGSDHDIRGAFTSYEAYFGAYEIDGHEGTVTHRLEAALFPTTGPAANRSDTSNSPDGV